jgi:hypothetical protein
MAALKALRHPKSLGFGLNAALKRRLPQHRSEA